MQLVLKSKNKTKTEKCILDKMSGRPFHLGARGRKTKQRKGLIRVNGEGNVKRNGAVSAEAASPDGPDDIRSGR